MGRPRIHANASAAARAAERRKIAAGCKRKTYYLSAVSVSNLEELVEITGVSEAALIERLIEDYAEIHLGASWERKSAG